MSEIWQSDNRKISAELYLGVSGSISFGSGNLNTLANFTLERSLVSGNNLTFGNVCSSTLTVEIKNVVSTNLPQIYNNQYVALLLQCEDLNTHQISGEYYTGFFIDEITKTPCKHNSMDLMDITIVCHDFISRLDVEYNPTIDISEGQTVANIVRDCVTHSGHSQAISFTFRGFSNQLTVNTLPENVSRREELGYVAGYQGINIISRTTGEIDQVRLDAVSFRNNFGIQISKSMQYMDEMSIEGDTVFVSRVESGTENDVVVYPTDGSLVNSVSYPCPYITNETNGQPNEVSGQQRVREIQESIIAFAKSITPSSTSLQFEPMSVRWRGDTDVDIGDYIRVEDQRGFYSRCLVMSNTISFDGGLSQTLKCYGEAQKTVAFNTNTTMRAFERQITHLETEISDATAAITDLSIINGEFSFIKSPTDNHNIGWKIISLADGHFIECNKNGIGFSSNGGQTFDTAIYIDENGDGHINGTYITGLVVTTSMLDFTPITTANVDSYVQADINSWYNGLVIQGSKISSISSIPGYASLNGRVNSKVSATQATNIASEQVANFAASGKFTYIGDDGIYTGSITAQQLQVGWGGVNYAVLTPTEVGSKMSWSVNEDTESVTITNTNDIRQSSTGASCLSAPFYCVKGSKISWGCYPSIDTDATGKCIMRIDRSDTDSHTSYSVVDTLELTSADHPSPNNPIVRRQKTVVCPSDGYYWLYIGYTGTSSTWVVGALSSLHSAFVTISVTGNAVINGRIQSIDGKTYFDLENSIIETTSGNNVVTITNGSVLAKSGTTSANSSVLIDNGEIALSWKSSGTNGEVGKITQYTYYEEPDGPTKYGLSILYNSNQADGLILGRYTDVIMRLNYTLGVRISTDLQVDGRINNSSTEAVKKQISEYTGDALGLINDSKIYKFLYKKEEDTDPFSYGLIIERECPKEIVSKTNDGISLYSMASLSWKAIQELSKRIDNLEEKL